MRWLARHWFGYCHNSVLLTDRYTKYIEKLIDNNGIEFAIRHNKEMRLIVTRYLCGSPLLVSDRIIGIKDGFPKAIYFLKQLADGSISDKRLLLTLLTSTRAIRHNVEPSYESILSPFKGKKESVIPKEFINEFISKYGIELFVEPYTKQSHFLALSAGPTGRQSLLAMHNLLDWPGTLWAAAQHLLSSTVVNLADEAKLFYKSLNRDYQDKKVSNLEKAGYKLGDRPLRRISIVNDPELKARVIAIGDYFSQLSMEGLSKQLFSILKRIPEDRTFTQDPTIGIPIEGHHYHSLDLTAATDRFPIKQQRDILAEMLGPSYADSWKHMMISQPFALPNGNTLKYTVGQPMGMRSSWVVFTLSHHMIVQYAAKLAGVNPDNNYILLGDDIVIINDDIAQKYEFLMEQLGVGISRAKTHVSKDTYEFAKRWLQNGIEITGFPVNSVVSTINSPFELFNSIYIHMQRGLGPMNLMNSIDITMKLYQILGKTSKELKRIRKALWNFRFTYRNLHNPDPLEIREFLCMNTLESYTDEYVLPASETVLLKELKRISDVVVNDLVIDKVVELYDFKKTYMDNMTLINNEHHEIHPFTLGVSNSLYELEEKVMGLQKSKWKDLTEALSATVMIDPQTSFEPSARNTKKMIFMLSSFGIKLKEALSFDPYYTFNINQAYKIGRAVYDLSRSFNTVTGNDPRHFKPYFMYDSLVRGKLAETKQS